MRKFHGVGMKIKNQIAKWVLASLILATFVSFAGEELFAQNGKAVKTMISVSCQGLENCEIEGRILYSQGQPINKIIHGMCSLQWNSTAKTSCYSFAYRLATRLGKAEIQRGYEGNFPWTTVKGYIHVVRRTCERFICLVGEDRCEVQAISYWQELSLNLKTEIEGILRDMLAHNQN